jgi:hypothetical protein
MEYLQKILRRPGYVSRLNKRITSRLVSGPLFPFHRFLPSHSETPFKLTQLVLFVLFVVVEIRAGAKFHNYPLQAA